MSLAFLILAHQKPAQFKRLFDAIYHREDTFVLHFDRRAPAALHDLGRTLALVHSNVLLMPARKIFWGGPVIVHVQLEAMRLALITDSRWTHFINLSGQDFPLKSRDEMIDFLEAAREKSYLSWFDPLGAPVVWSDARKRMIRHHIAWPWLHHLLTLPGIGRRLRRICGWQNGLPYIPGYLRRWPDFFRYYGGANHVALARATAGYLLENTDARRIIDWLQATGVSDEILFQSVLLNSPLAPTLINATLREIDFPRGSVHPRIFTAADLPRLFASPALFARKFDEGIDSVVLDRLEERVRHVPVLQP